MEENSQRLDVRRRLYYQPVLYPHHCAHRFGFIGRDTSCRLVVCLCRLGIRGINPVVRYQFSIGLSLDGAEKRIQRLEAKSQHTTHSRDHPLIGDTT